VEACAEGSGRTGDASSPKEGLLLPPTASPPPTASLARQSGRPTGATLTPQLDVRPPPHPSALSRGVSTTIAASLLDVVVTISTRNGVRSFRGVPGLPLNVKTQPVAELRLAPQQGLIGIALVQTGRKRDPPLAIQMVGQDLDDAAGRRSQRRRRSTAQAASIKQACHARTPRSLARCAAFPSGKRAERRLRAHDRILRSGCHRKGYPRPAWQRNEGKGMNLRNNDADLRKRHSFARSSLPDSWSRLAKEGGKE